MNRREALKAIAAAPLIGLAAPVAAPKTMAAKPILMLQKITTKCEALSIGWTQLSADAYALIVKAKESDVQA